MFNIIELATKFTEQTLRSLDPNSRCFTISYALSICLQFHQIGTVVESGYFDNQRPHFALLLCEDNKILDTTIKQFGDHYPFTYFGDRHPHYDNFTPIPFLSVFKQWDAPLTGKESSITFLADEGKVRKPEDIRADIEVIRRAAAILKQQSSLKAFLNPEHLARFNLFVNTAKIARKPPVSSGNS